MIQNKEKEGLHYISVKKLSPLLKGIASNLYGGFYELNWLHSFRTENKLKSQENVCKNKDFCGIVMPSKYDNILGFNQYMKSDKVPYIVNADIESFVKKIDGCANNPENYSTTKRGEHIPCGCSMSTFDHIEYKHTLYCGKDCMKKFCKSLREQVKI